MRDFHQTWYQPPSITAVAVGNLPVEELVEIIAQEFTIENDGKIPNVQNINPPELPFTEIVRQEFVDEKLQQARLIMVWRVPGLMQLSETYPLDILAGILGHGRTSRLVRDLREERRLVSSISVSNISNKLQGTFYITAKCDVENLASVEEAIAEHMRQIQRELVKESEIARVRRRVANRFIFANETPSDRAGLYGYYQSLVGDLEPAFNYPDYIQSQDAEKLMESAQKYLSPEAYGVVLIKPH